MLDEAADLVDPRRVEDDAGPQKQEPGGACRRRSRFKPQPERSFGRQKIAAGDVGDRCGLVVRAGVGAQNLGDQPRGRARYQRRKGPYQRAFQNPGWQ